MKRFLSILIALSTLSGLAFTQRTLRVEDKPSTPATTTRSEVANASAERRALASVRNKGQAERFQQVAVALNLSSRQKKGVATLIQNARKEMAAAAASHSLSPEQQQQAAQTIRLDVAQKFVGLLTPEQKTDLASLLLKRKQQNSNSNSSSAASGGGASAPDIPSVDAPASSDSGDSESASSSTASSSDTSSTDSTSGNTVASASGSTAPTTSTPAQPASATATAPGPGPSAKPGHLSDAQLAAILNSFVEDESADSGAKQSAQTATASSS